MELFRKIDPVTKLEFLYFSRSRLSTHESPYLLQIKILLLNSGLTFYPRNSNNVQIFLNLYYKKNQI